MLKNDHLFIKKHLFLYKTRKKKRVRLYCMVGYFKHHMRHELYSWIDVDDEPLNLELIITHIENPN